MGENQGGKIAIGGSEHSGLRHKFLDSCRSRFISRHGSDVDFGKSTDCPLPPCSTSAEMLTQLSSASPLPLRGISQAQPAGARDRGGSGAADGAQNLRRYALETCLNDDQIGHIAAYG